MDAGGVYRVGRDPANDIVIEHGSVSREHCELRLQDDGTVLLVDLGSMNGTAVRQNGQWEPVEQATVECDERILLGEIVTTVAALLLRAPRGSNAEAPKPAPAPRRIPKPTAPANPEIYEALLSGKADGAKPEAGSLIGRLIQSDWARLNRRAPRKPVQRDEPSICLPAFVSVPEVAEPARLLRDPPSLKPPVRTAVAPPEPAAVQLASAQAAAEPERHAPSLRVEPAMAAPTLDAEPEPAAHPAPPHLAPGPQPTPRRPLIAPYRRRRGLAWAAQFKTKRVARWAVAAGVLMLASGAAVAAFVTYTPSQADRPQLAAATGNPPSPKTAPKAPDLPPGAKPGVVEKTAPGAKPAKGPWQRRIEAAPESAVAAAAASHDGLCVAGSTSLPTGGQEAWVMRLDSAGAVQWQRRPGGPKRDAALAVTALRDGGCVAAGFDRDEARLWIFSLDKNGVLGWSRTIPTGHSGRAVAILRTRDGGYAVAAFARSAADAPDRAFVLRLDSRGEIRWSRYAGRSESRPADLRETPDGGFVVAGVARGRSEGPLELWIARLDRKGHTLWDERYAGAGTPSSPRVDIARGREFIIAATMTQAGAGPALRLLRVNDKGGAAIWDRSHAGAARRVAGMVLVRGGIVVAGDAGSNAARPELWLSEFDAQGRARRDSRIAAGTGDRAAGLAELARGHFALVGTAAFDDGRRGAGLILVDRDRALLAER
ncbi:MAG: FHA domain-containing protein [Rhodospirillaceae bacterium]|nr:FHA domain-containing protein [Rhodospirillaceae bacterium]